MGGECREGVQESYPKAGRQLGKPLVLSSPILLATVWNVVVMAGVPTAILDHEVTFPKVVERITERSLASGGTVGPQYRAGCWPLGFLTWGLSF